MLFFYLNMGGPDPSSSRPMHTLSIDDEKKFQHCNDAHKMAYDSVSPLEFKLSELTITIYCYGDAHRAIRVSTESENDKYYIALATARACMERGFNILSHNCVQVCAFVLSSIDEKFAQEGNFMFPGSFDSAIERHYSDAIAEHHEKYRSSWMKKFFLKNNQ